jgi:hypothetical protein
MSVFKIKANFKRFWKSTFMTFFLILKNLFQKYRIKILIGMLKAYFHNYLLFLNMHLKNKYTFEGLVDNLQNIFDLIFLIVKMLNLSHPLEHENELQFFLI